MTTCDARTVVSSLRDSRAALALSSSRESFVLTFSSWDDFCVAIELWICSNLSLTAVILVLSFPYLTEVLLMERPDVFGFHIMLLDIIA